MPGSYLIPRFCVCPGVDLGSAGFDLPARDPEPPFKNGSARSPQTKHRARIAPWRASTGLPARCGGASAPWRAPRSPPPPHTPSWSGTSAWAVVAPSRCWSAASRFYRSCSAATLTLTLTRCVPLPQLLCRNPNPNPNPVRAERSSEVPAEFARLAHTPAVPYPGWDADWDGLTLPAKAVAKDLGHSWPIADYAAAIRTLFVEHYAFSTTSRYRSLAEVERAIERRREKGEGELEDFYRESYMRHAWGGAPVKHVILVRHGQYEERHDLERQLQAAVGGQQFELDERQQRGAYLTLDQQRVLTPLGRRQAEATGDRLAALLRPALTTEGREADVRVHCSTLSRAKETADLIAARLAPHV
eukprot:scaffold61222_cov71-Phaeocystis_antarctica.AAC.1